MEEAAAVRRAALEAVEDVEPETLRERIEDHVAEGSMDPGVLTLLSAGASVDGGASPPADRLTERGAGVQLIYDGLRLTRTLSQTEPWDNDPTAVKREGADLEILVADILVARGFYLLARTEAADAAVATVRSFGRDQTTRRETDDPSLDAELERDVFELAVVAGTTAAGHHPSPQLREYATDLAHDDTTPDDGTFSDAVRERLGTLVRDGSSGDGVAPTTENRNA
ncbi:MAG: hypothetical protein ABEI96_10170 [Haloarculaceae archaeon]